uniref:Uncharacterized protein n=1 Tax=Triticum urartu TaxID=4572 RepID=A0A8R7P233_TRIUA
MHRANLGEGGSRAGGTCRVRKAWLMSLGMPPRSAPSLHLRCTPPLDPLLRECLSSLSSKPLTSASPAAP